MNRTFGILTGMMCVGVGLAAVLHAASGPSGTASAWPGKKQNEQKPQASPAKAAASTPAQPPTQAPAASAGEKVVFTFDNDDKMKEFAQLWQQRQIMVLRMRALQSYFDDDQKKLAELNEKFVTDYKVDTKKNYSLDPKRRALIEHEAPPAAPAAAGPAPTDQPAAAPAP